jgi:hypothetical protein
MGSGEYELFLLEEWLLVLQHDLRIRMGRVSASAGEISVNAVEEWKA